MVEVPGSNPGGPTNFPNVYAAFRAKPQKVALHNIVRPKLDPKNNLQINQTLIDLLDHCF